MTQSTTSMTSLPRVAADAGAVLVEQVDRIDELAVDVELELLDRGVADAHRLRVAVPAQVVQFDFLGGQVAVDVVEDAQRAESVVLAGARGPAVPRASR